jgi:tetratricopeptide (TPR) repeat protein
MLYFFGLDHTESRRLLADAALRTAIRLRPDAGETHLARADYLYRCYLDYDHARAELEIAARALPNRPLVFMEIAAISRREGRWQDCIRNFEKAVELDPQNVFPLQQKSFAHQYLRQFPEMAKALDRALALQPNDGYLRSWRALVELDWKADPKPLHETIHQIVSENPAAAEG